MAERGRDRPAARGGRRAERRHVGSRRRGERVGGARVGAPVSRGAALTEFAVLTLILIPLLVGIPMIGKLVDLRQVAVQASRYAAWEATVDPHARPPRNVGERFFGDPAGAIVSAPSAAGDNPLWGEAARAGGPADPERGAAPVTLDPAATAALAYARAPHDGVARRAAEAVRGVGEALERDDSEWGLMGDGLLAGGVRVGVAANGWLEGIGGGGEGGGCAAWRCFEERSVIMVDGWSAGGIGQATRRVRSLVPMGALEELGNVVSHIGALPLFKELRGLDGALGHVDLAALPASEAGRLRTLRPYAEGSP